MPVLSENQSKAITQERMEKALIFLAESDLSCATLKANMERAEFKAKSMKATTFRLGAGTVADRNAEAEIHPTVQEAYESYFVAVQDYNALANKRSTNVLVVDVWRSINANRRQG